MVPSEHLTPVIDNVAIAVIDTQYSVAVPAGCRGFEIRERAAAELRMAFTAGIVATPTGEYVTIPAAGYSTPEKFALDATGLTIYLAGDATGTAEIIFWVKA